MAVIRLDDVSMVYPFIRTDGIFDRRKKQEILARQQAMPYTSNEGVVALQHFSTTINDGEFVAVLGPSGSGKTTLLRIIAGLERPPLGTVYYDDVDLQQTDIEDRDIGMVFQNFSLYPNQTVYRNIAFPLEVKHVPREQIEEHVREIAGMLGLQSKLEKLPEELSGGEKQRVAIARALVKRPSVLLLDEPFANLDVVVRQKMRDLLKRIHGELKTTFIYVTHDQYDAFALADRIILLKDGIKQMDDTAVNVYNHPVNRFCGEFLGLPVMNIFEDLKVDKGSFELLGNRYELSPSQKKRCKNGEKIDAGIRGTNIRIGKEGIEAEVEYAEVIEADQIVHLIVGDRKITAVEKMNDVSGMTYLRGDKVMIEPDPEKIHLFGKDGARI